MNPFTSQGMPRLGSTLDNGVMSAPARLASAEPKQNVMKRTRSLLIPSAMASGSFMITARASRPSLVALRSAPIPPATTTAARTRNSRYCEYVSPNMVIAPAIGV